MSLIIGLCGIAFSLYFSFTSHQKGFHGFIDYPSMVLLGICPPSIMLLSHTIGDFFSGIAIFLQSLVQRHRRLQMSVIDALTRASATVRSEGMGALIKERDRAKYPLFRDGLSLILADFTPEEIKHNLTAKINAKQSQMAISSNLFENMSKACPGVGMMGTLMGLILMLSKLDDPTNIGGGMAFAMITTLYGLLLGTIIYAPWGEKIALEAEKYLELDLFVLEGVLHIKGKKSNLHLKDIMKTYAGIKPKDDGRSRPAQPNTNLNKRGA